MAKNFDPTWEVRDELSPCGAVKVYTEYTAHLPKNFHLKVVAFYRAPQKAYWYILNTSEDLLEADRLNEAVRSFGGRLYVDSLENSVRLAKAAAVEAAHKL